MDLDPRARPTHHPHAHPELDVQAAGEPSWHQIVSPREARDVVASILFGRLRLLRDGLHAGAIEARRIESFEEVGSELPFVRRGPQPPAKRPQRLVDGPLEHRRQLADLLHCRLPQLVAALHSVEIMSAAELAGVARERQKRSRPAVEELGAHFQRERPPGQPDGMHAAADPVARFKHHHLEAPLFELARRGKPCHAGADHDRVHGQGRSAPGTARGSLAPGSGPRLADGLARRLSRCCLAGRFSRCRLARGRLLRMPGRAFRLPSPG